MALDIFRMSADREMTPTLLSKYIHKNDVKAVRYRKLLNAYNNDYAIFHQQIPKDSWKPNHRIAVNFCQVITDAFEGFFIGNPIKTTSSDEKVSKYVNFLDAYNDQDDKNSELSKIVSIFGRGYEIYYTDEEGYECISYLEPTDAFMIYDEAIQPHPLYFVRTYTGDDNIRRGSISNKEYVRYFDIVAGGIKWTSEPIEHYFSDVPATEFIMNSQRRGIFENVMSLCDAFNKTISAKCNDVDYFSNAMMKVLGGKIDAETMKFMRENRIVNFAGKSASDLVVEFMQKPDGDTTQENLLTRIQNLIFITAMVVNVTDDVFNNASGIALRYKLSPQLNLFKVKERKFTSGLNRRYKILFSNPVSGMNKDDWTTLEYTFTPNMPVDTADEAETASKLSGITSRKTQLKIISAVSDVDAELEQIEKEQDLEGYNTDYPTDRVTE